MTTQGTLLTSQKGLYNESVNAAHGSRNCEATQHYLSPTCVAPQVAKVGRFVGARAQMSLPFSHFQFSFPLSFSVREHNWVYDCPNEG